GFFESYPRTPAGLSLPLRELFFPCFPPRVSARRTPCRGPEMSAVSTLRVLDRISSRGLPCQYESVHNVVNMVYLVYLSSFFSSSQMIMSSGSTPELQPTSCFARLRPTSANDSRDNAIGTL